MIDFMLNVFAEIADFFINFRVDKVVTMPPAAAQMMMKAVDFLLLVPYPQDKLIKLQKCKIAFLYAIFRIKNLGFYKNASRKCH